MQDLQATISREVALLTDFVKLLGDEQQTLKDGDADALPVFTQRKTVLMEALNALAALRNSQLAEAGCAKDKEGMSQWLSRHPGEKLTGQSWSKLLQLAEQGRELNKINGQLIQMRLQATQEALSSLTQNARQTSLYGRDGQASPLTGYRIIDSA